MMKSAMLFDDANIPLSVVIRGRSEELVICDELELIADQLAGKVDGKLCSSALRRLSVDFLLHQKDEEVLYEILRERDINDHFLAQCIKQALMEHHQFEDYVPELVEPLGEIGSGKPLANPEASGYAFRCLFDGVRRHIAWEDITLLGHSMPPLTDQETARLQVGIASNRRLFSRHLRITN